MAKVRIGCSGWNYRDWREAFYPRGCPQRRWLEHYATAFDTVEVNTTFYRLPRRRAVDGWAKATPPDFLFTLKASRYLTHMKRLTDLDRGVQRYYERIEPIIEAGKLGPVLWQLPETFRRDDARLAAALDRLPPGRHAFEFRHPSWFDADGGARTLDLLDDAGAALVIGDHPERPFQPHVLTAGFTVIRFHYGGRGRRGNYSDAELETWADRITAWSRRADVFAYFNNDWEAFAPRNAAHLQRLVQR